MRYGNILQMDDVVNACCLVLMCAIADIRVSIVLILLERIEIKPARCDRAILEADTAAVRIEFALRTNVQLIRLQDICSTCLAFPPVVPPIRRSLIIVELAVCAQRELRPRSVQLCAVCVDGIPDDTERCFTVPWKST